MAQMLDKGLHLCLYPEGTRNKTEEPMQAFYDGAFTTAIRSQKPIIPGVIFNTRGVFPGKPAFWAWPNRIHFHFLEEIPTEGLTTADASRLKDDVRAKMEGYFVANRERLK
jgi:1-acyl-sn-glycerol-3-phosphate acyltransferase